MKNSGKQTGRWSAYRITSPCHAAVAILAPNMTSAIAMAIEYRRLRGIGEVRLTIDPNWAMSLSGLGRQHVEEARAICRQTSVVTLYRADSGWAVGGPELCADDD